MLWIADLFIYFLLLLLSVIFLFRHLNTNISMQKIKTQKKKLCKRFAISTQGHNLVRDCVRCIKKYLGYTEKEKKLHYMKKCLKVVITKVAFFFSWKKSYEYDFFIFFLRENNFSIEIMLPC